MQQTDNTSLCRGHPRVASLACGNSSSGGKTEGFDGVRERNCSLPQAASLTAPSSHPPAGGRTKRNRRKAAALSAEERGTFLVVHKEKAQQIKLLCL